MVINTKVNGKIINKMVKVSINFKMETNIKVSSKMEWNIVKESLYAKIMNNMKDNGLTINKLAKFLKFMKTEIHMMDLF